MLELLREQAEASSPEVRAAALLRIARVESTFDRDAAGRTFHAGLDAIRELSRSPRKWLGGQARLMAAAISPELLHSIRVEGQVGFHFDPDTLVQVMLDHGHQGGAISYILEQDHGPAFPIMSLAAVMHSTRDEPARRALLRRAIEAWRNGGIKGFRCGHNFVGIFRLHWTLLPRSEALSVLHEIIEDARRQPSQGHLSARYDAEGKVKITARFEITLFDVLNVMRALDPGLAESLISEHEQLAAAARRFPNGHETILEEAKARRPPGAEGGGYCMVGSPEDFPYLHSLMDAERGGNFERSFGYALEKYAKDAVSSNYAPKEFWGSTNEFRTVLYRAGRRVGSSAAGFLVRIPDPDMRLLAAIELEAALAGLPETTSATIHLPRPALDEKTTDDTGGPGIRCPKCGWRPGPHDRWACKCGHIWNTFDTGGVCPACLYQWTETACLRCGEWSPHSDWYAQD